MTLFMVIAFFDSEDKNTSLSLVLLAPIGWLILLFTYCVEHIALYKAVISIIRKKELSWQKWNRIGIKDYQNLLGTNT